MEIMNNVKNLSTIEYRIYNYVKENPEAVLKMSIQKLAKETYTSTATVLRFCRKYGLSGFSEFKYTLKHDLTESFNDSSDALSGIDDEVINFFKQQAGTKKLEEEIKKAAEDIAGKSLIIFVGIGNSNLSSRYAMQFFSLFNTLCFRVEDLQNYPKDLFNKNISEKTCIIVFSVSGETRHVIEYVSNFSKSKCHIIAVTNNSSSRLANLANHVISTNIPVLTYQTNDYTTQIPFMYIAEKLAKQVYELKK